MVRLLDFVLHEWNGRAVVDPAKIGLFAFSKGGYTALVLIGWRRISNRVARGCTDASKFCEQIKNTDIPALAQDARIRCAAVIADPIPGFFTQSNLAAITIPVQFWRAEVGIGVIDPEGTARVARALPGKPEIFIMCLPDTLRSQRHARRPERPRCLHLRRQASREFDRLAFHREFNGSVARFFHEQLVTGN